MYAIRRCTTCRDYWLSVPPCDQFWTDAGWGSLTDAIEFRKPWHAEDYAAANGVTGYAVCGPM